MSGLDEFFAQMKPFLLGQRDATQVEAALGESSSGTASLRFYRTLIARNFDKFLRDMYPSVAAFAAQLDAGLWRTLVSEYSAQTVPEHHDPNMFSREFPAFLERRRASHAEQPELLEQLADLQWSRHAVNIAPESSGDGFEQRLFLRQYAYPVPQFFGAISKQADASPPEPADTLAVIYRSFHDLRPRVLVVGVAELAVLAGRQGAQLPAALAQLPAELAAAAESRMVQKGVLRPLAKI